MSPHELFTAFRTSIPLTHVLTSPHDTPTTPGIPKIHRMSMSRPGGVACTSMRAGSIARGGSSSAISVARCSFAAGVGVWFVVMLWFSGGV